MPILQMRTYPERWGPLPKGPHSVGSRTTTTEVALDPRMCFVCPFRREVGALDDCGVLWTELRGCKTVVGGHQLEAGQLPSHSASPSFPVFVSTPAPCTV